MDRRSPGPLFALVLLLLVALALSACVKPRCTRNAECAAGQVCETATGVCVVPECTSDAGCGAGLVCAQFACVAGCRGDEECPVDQRCFAKHCVARDEACDCARAPDFCGLDLNPRSPTVGETVCAPAQFGDGVLLFFGSVLCSHCQDLLDALEGLQAEVLPAGDAPMIFVQEPSITVGGEVVDAALAGATLAVVQDDPDLGVWSAYAADWYHVVLIDRNGCLARHWGPLVSTDVSDTRHDEMRAAWLEAQDAVCTPASPDTAEPAPDVVEPALEVVPELTPDVSSDLSPDLALDVSLDLPTDVPLDSGPADVPPELFPEAAPEVADADVPGDVDAWVEPFQLQELCQVVAAAPAPIGGFVPHFLCQDLNASSLAFGAEVSDITLREQVWIAYFGTCT